MQPYPSLPVSCCAGTHGRTDDSRAVCAAGFCASLSSSLGCCVKIPFLGSCAEAQICPGLLPKLCLILCLLRWTGSWSEHPLLLLWYLLSLAASNGLVFFTGIYWGSQSLSNERGRAKRCKCWAPFPALSAFLPSVFPEDCFHSRTELSPEGAMPSRQDLAGIGWAAELDLSCTCFCSPACQAGFVPSCLPLGSQGKSGESVWVFLAGVWLGDKDSADLGDEEPLSL